MGELIAELIARLEREARKADVIADGATLYDKDFFRINPRTRKKDDERSAFVAYPDGARCWVDPPFSTAFTSDPRWLVVPSWIDRTFRVCHWQDRTLLCRLIAAQVTMALVLWPTGARGDQRRHT